MSIIAPNRLRAIALCLAYTTLGFSCLNVAGYVVSRMTPGIKKNKQDAVQYDTFELLGRKAAGVVRNGTSSTLSGGVVMGQSSAYWGIDLKTIKQECGGTWLKYTGNGGMVRLGLYAQPLLDSNIRFRTTVLCIHPLFLAMREQTSEENPGEAEDDWKGLAWVIQNRRRFGYDASMGLYAGRRWIFTSIGLGVDAQFKPEPDPWDSRPPQQNVNTVEEAKLARHLKLGHKFGWFKEESYDPDGNGMRTFRELLASLCKRSGRIAIVFMPERESIRSRVPELAADLIVQATHDLMGNCRIVVFDLRALLPDDHMYDLTHPNQAGRQILSRRLAAILSEED